MMRTAAQDPNPAIFHRRHRIILRVALLLLALNMFLGVEAYTGGAMSPTVRDGQMILWKRERYSLNRRLPKQGEIVILRKNAFSNSGESSSIRRVAGLPGKTAVIGEEMVALGVEQVYVISDNQKNGTGVRDDGTGVIRLADIKGRALWVIWPPSEIGRIR